MVDKVHLCFTHISNAIRNAVMNLILHTFTKQYNMLAAYCESIYLEIFYQNSYTYTPKI